MNRRTFLARAASLLVLPGIVLAAAPAQPAAGTTTIIIVRHGEKETEPPDDPALSPAGEARALALADAVRGSGISAIYSTRYRRTQATARPASEQLKVPITTLNAAPPAYVAELLAKQRGKTVLVVGHSNTVPLILQAFGIADAPSIADSEYDNFFIVTIPETGPARVIRARYGAR